MSRINVIRPQKISLKNHPELTEAWVQNQIMQSPEILGIGDLIVKSVERIQSGLGRLDLLLIDPDDDDKRYEIEIQLGATDPSHIIRTIEYWDYERKRYPQFDHCAVIIAEEIRNRFFNIISLFNGHIPIIAIKLDTYKINNDYFLVFTKILDERQIGFLEDDEKDFEPTDRDYWRSKRSTPEMLEIVDEFYQLIKDIVPAYELKYNQAYIGLAMNDKADNFIVFKPKKTFVKIEIRIQKSDILDDEFENRRIEITNYNSKRGRYIIRLTKNQIKKNKDFITGLIKRAKDLSVEEN